MTISKVPWRKPPIPKQVAVICTRLILPDAVPAVKKTDFKGVLRGQFASEGLENTPRRYAIVRTNKILVDSCDWLVCYVRHGTSNSQDLLEYANRREEKGLIQIVNIGESEDEEK